MLAELDDDGFLKTEKKLVVLNVDLPMELIQEQYPKLYSYLQEGIAKGSDFTAELERLLHRPAGAEPHPVPAAVELRGHAEATRLSSPIPP